MAVPQTREEALAKGFKPVKDLDALIRKVTGKSAEAYFRQLKAELVEPINCNDAANDGKQCRVIDGGHGKLIILFCHDHACSQKNALFGPAD